LAFYILGFPRVRLVSFLNCCYRFWTKPLVTDTCTVSKMVT